MTVKIYHEKNIDLVEESEYEFRSVVKEIWVY